MKKLVLLAAILLTVGVAAVSAQEADIELEQTVTEEEEVNVGMFTPDSALYGLETAWDNAAMSLGVSSPGDVAQKRAAEAQTMANQGNYEAAERAVRGLETAAERAGEDDAQDIQQATERLEQVIEDAPEEAIEGLQTAMENIGAAAGEEVRDEMPSELPVGGPEEGEETTDEEVGEADQPQPDEEPGETSEQETEGPTQVVINGGNYYFEPETVEIEAGEEVEVVFANEGGLHDLVIPEEDVETEQIGGGERASFTHTFEEEGTYEFICSVGNHAAQGMTGEIEVVSS